MAADLLNADENLTDELMVEEVDSHGQLVPRGALLRMMIEHHTHHRGRMTVLLRHAGLKVPGVMGPTKERCSYLLRNNATKLSSSYNLLFFNDLFSYKEERRFLHRLNSTRFDESYAQFHLTPLLSLPV